MNLKYLKHALQHPMAQRADVARRVFNMPICPKCERLAFRHKSKNNVKCPVCGYEGPPGPQFGQHMRTV